MSKESAGKFSGVEIIQLQGNWKEEFKSFLACDLKESTVEVEVIDESAKKKGKSVKQPVLQHVVKRQACDAGLVKP